MDAYNKEKNVLKIKVVRVLVNYQFFKRYFSSIGHD